MSKRRNEYCEAFGPLYDEIPKAVFAAVAYSLGEQLATGSGAAMVLREWRILHDNAIVPQAPPPYRLRDLRPASPAGAGGSGELLGGPTASVAGAFMPRKYTGECKCPQCGLDSRDLTENALPYIVAHAFGSTIKLHCQICDKEWLHHLKPGEQGAPAAERGGPDAT